MHAALWQRGKIVCSSLYPADVQQLVVHHRVVQAKICRKTPILQTLTVVAALFCIFVIHKLLLEMMAAILSVKPYS